MGKSNESTLNANNYKHILACLRMKVENIEYNFAENKCLIRNQKLLVK